MEAEAPESDNGIELRDDESPEFQEVHGAVLTLDFPEEEISVPSESAVIDCVDDPLLNESSGARTSIVEPESFEQHTGVDENFADTPSVSSGNEITVSGGCEGCTSPGTVVQDTVDEHSRTRKRPVDRCDSVEDDTIQVFKKELCLKIIKKRNSVKPDLQTDSGSEKKETSPVCFEAYPSTSAVVDIRRASRKRQRIEDVFTEGTSTTNVVFVSSATQTMSVDDLFEKCVMNSLNNTDLGKCGNEADLKCLRKHYGKLRYAFIRCYARTSELEKENRELKTHLRRFGEKMLEEKEQQRTEFDALKTDFQTAATLLADYHKGFLNGCDEIDARHRDEKMIIADAMSERGAACDKLKGLMKLKSDQIDVLMKKMDDLNRQLSVENRDTYLARQHVLEADQRVEEAEQRATAARKKLDDQLYMACNTKCASCKVYEKNRTVLYSQIADQTVIKENVMKENKELRSKFENYEKAVEKLEKEIACLTFEKRSWETTAKRLEDELKALKASGGLSSSAALTPCPSNNSTSSEEAGEIQLKNPTLIQPLVSSESAKPDQVQKCSEEKKSALSVAPSDEAKAVVSEKVEQKQKTEFVLAPLSTDSSLLEMPFAFSSWAKQYRDQDSKPTEKARDNANMEAKRAKRLSNAEGLRKSDERTSNVSVNSKYPRFPLSGARRNRNENIVCDKSVEMSRKEKDSVIQDAPKVEKGVSEKKSMKDAMKDAVKSAMKDAVKSTMKDATKPAKESCSTSKGGTSVGPKATEKRDIGCSSSAYNGAKAAQKDAKENAASERKDFRKCTDLSRNIAKNVSAEDPFSQTKTEQPSSGAISSSILAPMVKGPGDSRSIVRTSMPSSDKESFKVKKTLIHRPIRTRSPLLSSRDPSHGLCQQMKSLLESPRRPLGEPSRNCFEEPLPRRPQLHSSSLELRQQWERASDMDYERERLQYVDARELRARNDYEAERLRYADARAVRERSGYQMEHQQYADTRAFERDSRPRFPDRHLPVVQESWRFNSANSASSRQDECWNMRGMEHERFGYPDMQRW